MSQEWYKRKFYLLPVVTVDKSIDVIVFVAISEVVKVDFIVEGFALEAEDRVVFCVVIVKVDVATVDSAVDKEESVETTVFSSVADVTVDMTKIIQCNYFFSKSTLPSDVVFVVNSVDVIVVRVDVTIVDFSVDLAVEDSVEVSLLTDGETVVEVDETENIL